MQILGKLEPAALIVRAPALVARLGIPNSKYAMWW